MPQTATKNKVGRPRKNTAPNQKMTGTKGGAGGAAVRMGQTVSDNLNLSGAQDWSTFQSAWLAHQNRYGQMEQQVKDLKAQVAQQQKWINQLCGINHKSYAATEKLYQAMNPAGTTANNKG